MKEKILTIGILFLMLLIGLGIMFLPDLIPSMNRQSIDMSDEALGIGPMEPETLPISIETPTEPEVTPIPTETPTDEPEAMTEKHPAVKKVERYYYEEVSGITNIAIFGVDAIQGRNGRSDAIMILTIDRNSGKIKLTSIPRDSYVNIPGKGMDKITHAYAFGGAQFALKTLNTNFNLDIKNYLTVNFTSLPKVIDALGGVVVTITDKESGIIPGLSNGGEYELNGEQALTFMRIRKIDTDFERGRRQRDTMESALNKGMDMPASSYPGLLAKILPLVTTNMKSADILEMATNVISMKSRTIEQNRFPQEDVAKGKKINGTYYYVFDIEATKEAMGQYLYLDK